jgi:hypothetical protein
MSAHEIYDFLKRNEGTAYTLKELERRIETSNIRKKLQKLVKFKYIKTQHALVDYHTYSNARPRYFYVGTVREYVPRPKMLVVAR